MKITPEIEAYLAEQLEKQKNEIELKIAQSTMNKIKYGCEVVDLIKIEGKPIIDKETKQQKELNGQLSFYPDKYLVKISGTGLELDTPINKSNFESLSIGSKYLAVGRLAIVTEFGNSVVKPVFTEFIKL